MNKIDLDFLIASNILVTQASGEIFNILDKNKLLSALSLQDNNYYENDNQLCAAVLRSIIIAHGFEQGNKRVAFATIKHMNPPKCSDMELKDIILEIANAGGSNIDLNYLTTKLYGE